MTIQTLQISYPSFQLGATIDPEQFNTNNGEIVSKVNEIKEVVNSNMGIGQILLAVYPIGAVYMTVNNTNPASIFGGTWEAWGSGRVPVGVDATQTEFDTVEKTGGEKTHTLTTNEMPTHNHGAISTSGTGGNATVAGWSITGAVTAQNTNYATTGTAGGGQPHNNLQPYITCYMWKRTA